MSRTAICSALILRNRPSGESNSEVFMLTAEEGIVRATVFGGPKSKLRAHSAPYNSGQVWIYRDKSKDYAKISDFDVRSWRAGLREMYERTMAAAAVSDTILSSHGGGGEWGSALKLAADTLDALETANEEQCSRLLIHFLWRWADFLGIQPYVEFCSSCGQGADSPLWFNAQEGTALCANCAHHISAAELSARFLHINPGSRRWLIAAGNLEPSQLHRYSMDSKSFYEAKALTAAVMTGALGKRLASWEW